MTTFFYQDSKWLEVSASLRVGILYVKMPRSKGLRLVQSLHATSEDLLEKQIEASEKSFVFYGPASDWRADLPILKKVLEKTSEESRQLLLTEVIGTIKAGLRCDPAVDWIARIGGPAPRPDEGRHSPEGCSSCSSGSCGPSSREPGQVEFIDL